MRFLLFIFFSLLFKFINTNANSGTESTEPVTSSTPISIMYFICAKIDKSPNEVSARRRYNRIQKYTIILFIPAFVDTRYMLTDGCYLLPAFHTTRLAGWLPTV